MTNGCCSIFDVTAFENRFACVHFHPVIAEFLAHVGMATTISRRRSSFSASWAQTGRASRCSERYEALSRLHTMVPPLEFKSILYVAGAAAVCLDVLR